jgi:hypothetical protein
VGENKKNIMILRCKRDFDTRDFDTDDIIYKDMYYVVEKMRVFGMECWDVFGIDDDVYYTCFWSLEDLYSYFYTTQEERITKISNTLE